MRELRIYGPGGPYEAVQECCDIWTERTGLRTKVIKGPPEEWAQAARHEGDLMYFGAENMLEEFGRKFPGLIDSRTVRCPFRRRVGIIVRKANPHRLGSLLDLAAKEITLLAVDLEKMDEFFDAVPGIRQRIGETVVTGEKGFAVWQSNLTIDAWITYRSWHVKLTGAEEFVQFDAGARIYRATPLALTATSRRRARALELADFLSSEAAHTVFRKWGWE